MNHKYNTNSMYYYVRSTFMSLCVYYVYVTLHMITGTCFLTHVCGSEKTGVSTATQEARTDSCATGDSTSSRSLSPV